MSQLFAHQHEAATFLSRRRKALLWGDPGIGKTAGAVEAMRIGGVTRALIICPLSVVNHWQAELLAWGGFHSQIVRHATDVWRSNILIINPNRLYDRHVLAALKQKGFTHLILDESQQFKNPHAKRTRIVFSRGGLAHLVESTWLLSGTPCPQGPIDLFVPMKVLWPETLGGLNRDGFIERYHVLAPDRIKIVGSRNMKELADLLQPHVLRQRIDECDLPPFRFQRVALPREDLHLDGDALRRALHAAGLDGWRDLTDDAVLQLVTEARLHLMAVRSLLAGAKARMLSDMAADELANGRPKLVIFSWHLFPLHGLHARLKEFNPLLLTGATPGPQRGEMIWQFQNNPAHRVLLAQGEVGGVGITLHAANECWFVDNPWTPASLVQAAKRLHRIGQKHPVLARVFTVKDTIDDVVTAILVKKAKMITDLQPDAIEGAINDNHLYLPRQSGRLAGHAEGH